MNTRFKATLLVTVVALCSLLLTTGAVFAADGTGGNGAESQNKEERGVLVRSVSDTKTIVLKTKGLHVVTPNASLPAPGGGTISWNVYSRLDLFQNPIGGRSAECVAGADTSSALFDLYLNNGQFKADGSSFTQANHYLENQVHYAWHSGSTFGNFGPSHFECAGNGHIAQVCNSCAINRLDTFKDTNW